MTTNNNHQHVHDHEESCAAARLCEVERDSESDGYGLHLTRTRWDPYPWISDVTKGSAADRAGLRQGDCVLQVNGHDLLGRPIADTARLIRAKAGKAQVLVWNCGDTNVDDDTSAIGDSEQALCCGPMPASLRRLAKCLADILAALECPVCLGTIPPPAHQCANGHLICVQCRARAERCPVCRLRFTRGRSLLADQVYEAMTDAFELRAVSPERRPERLRKRFMGSAKVPAVHVSPPKTPAPAPTHRLLSRLLGKSASVENLSASSASRLAPPPAELKTKSLSSSEIFLSPLTPSLTPVGSPVHSRPGSLANLSLQSRSHPGSMESLIGAGVGMPIQMPILGRLYACPFDDTCPARLPVGLLTCHGGRGHAVPLLVLWGPRTSVGLPLPSPDTIIVVQSSASDVDSDQDQLAFVRLTNGNQIQATMAANPSYASLWRLLVTPLSSPGAPVSVSFGSLAVAADSDMDDEGNLFQDHDHDHPNDPELGSGPTTTLNPILDPSSSPPSTPPSLIWSKAGVSVAHLVAGDDAAAAGAIDLEIRPTQSTRPRPASRQPQLPITASAKSVNLINS